MSDNILNTTFVRNNRGFTLIELLVTMVIVGLMMTAVYAVYVANVRAVSVEADRVEIQQDQRIAIDFLVRELRMAGYDKEESGLPGIVDARSNYIYFTADRNDDENLDDGGAPPLGDIDEHVAFCVYNSVPYGGQVLGYTVSNGNAVVDGINDTNNIILPTHTHNNTPTHQALGLVDNLEFLYHFTNGTLDTTNPLPGALGDIRGVTISLVTRADSPDRAFTVVQTFTPASNSPNLSNGILSGTTWNYPNDGIRRRIVFATVRFRNMGLD